MSKHKVELVNISEMIRILVRYKEQGAVTVNIDFEINGKEGDTIHIEANTPQRDYLQEEASKRSEESEKIVQTKKVLTIEHINRLLNI